MSILIKGMEIPKNCGDCPCAHIFEGYKCMAVERSFDKYPLENREDWCPLIEVPEPHGRLIDADAVHKLFEDQWHYLQVLDWNENPTAEAKQSGISWCINTMHDDAPTIIPESEVSE